MNVDYTAVILAAAAVIAIIVSVIVHKLESRQSRLPLMLIAVIASLGMNISTVSAADSEWKNPSADAFDTGGDNDGFETNPTYAYADGAGVAENSDGAGDSHRYYNYSFSIPTDANINGIEVRLDWYLDSDAGTSSMSVELSWDGGSDWTMPKTDTTESVSEHTTILGSSTDTWGRIWNWSEFSDGNFRVRVTCNSDEAGRDFYLDWVPVKVYYTPVAWLEVTGMDTMTAGGTNELTITAKDANGNVATGYSGSKNLTFSGPGVAPGGQMPTIEGVGIGSTTLVNFTNGVSDAGVATLAAYKAETTAVDVSDGAIDSFADPAYDLDLTVNPAAIDYYTVTSASYTQTTGVAFTVTVTAYDAYDNIVTTDSTTSVTLTSNSATMLFDSNGNGTFGEAGDNIKTLTAGTFDIQAKDTIAATGVTITATDANAKTGTSDPYTIDPFECFIATAAYGTSMAKELEILREFRDKYLLTNELGRRFVSYYYTYSPFIAKCIAQHDFLRAVVRVGLIPVIGLATIALKTTLVQKLILLLVMLTAIFASVTWIRKTRKPNLI